MSEQQEQLAEIAETIKKEKSNIERKNAFIRLQQNPDFKRIIEKEYLEDQAVRQVMMKASPSRQDEKAQKEHDNNIIAIGYLQQYFISILQRGYVSEQALTEHEQTQEELLQEDLTNG